MKYTKLIDRFKNHNISYEFWDNQLIDNINYPSIKMKNTNGPGSIKEREFNCIKNTIIKNDLKCGYEIATAFGISALSLGLGFKKTNGKIVTMDAYIEENSKNCFSYINKYNEVFYNSMGFKSITNIINEFKLHNIVYPTIGWSPIDTEKNIKKYINLDEEKLDLIFIDAGHWDNALISDIISIFNFINKDKYVIFIHDTHAFSSQCLNQIELLFNNKIVRIPSCEIPYGFCLSCITKNVDIVEYCIYNKWFE